MATISYPAFIYKVKDGFTVMLPDFPHAEIAKAVDYADALRDAQMKLSKEIERLKGQNRAIPPPTSLRSLVSTKGGQIETIEICGA